ncbi:hypothetical protein BX616_000343, partial [Lobosporangium transversale]
MLSGAHHVEVVWHRAPIGQAPWPCKRPHTHPLTHLPIYPFTHSRPAEGAPPSHSSFKNQR